MPSPLLDVRRLAISLLPCCRCTQSCQPVDLQDLKLEPCRLEDFEVDAALWLRQRMQLLGQRHMKTCLPAAFDANGTGRSPSIKQPLALPQVGRVLGTGSFGRVSLARHRPSGQVCAIKALSKAHIVKNQQARLLRL